MRRGPRAYDIAANGDSDNTRKGYTLGGIIMEMITMKAPDIGCEHCVATIKETAGRFPGVHAVEADVDTKIITLTYDPGQADLPKIEEALADEGYPVEK
jgi:copper chaperone